VSDSGLNRLDCVPENINEGPKISVVIPLHNEAATLRELYERVLA
jgi:cellulose synthase/poly-beta-1,6-N-acetylglucosamine synthase-like glycosyltransferase